VVKLRAMRRYTLALLITALCLALAPLSAGAQTSTRTATVTIVHGVVGGSPVDVYADGQLLASDVAFGQTVETVLPATVDVPINLVSGGSPISGSFPWAMDLTPYAGQHIALVASETTSGIGLTAFPLATNAATNKLELTDGSVQFMHATDFGAYDLYIDEVKQLETGGTTFEPGTSMVRNLTGGSTKTIALRPAGGDPTDPPVYSFQLGPIAKGDLTLVAFVSDDGGMNVDHVPLSAEAVIPLATRYSMIAADGGVFTFGNATYQGGLGGTTLNAPVIAGASTPSGNGYWLVAKDGGVFSFGDAQFYGSTGNMRLNSPVITMVATPTGGGYWLLAEDGGVFSFGDAQFYGSTGDMRLNSPVIAGVSTATGRGYWLVAKDGGVFSFGDAQFYGSTGNMVLNQPVIGIASAPGGLGYFLVASDGGVFTFGSADFYGSAVGQVNHPVVALATTPDQRGYWVASNRGEVKAFGNAEFLGDLSNTPLNGEIINIFS